MAAISKRHEAQPLSHASVSIKSTVYSSELTAEVNMQMVNDVRKYVTDNFDGCSICHLISGRPDLSHQSGEGCQMRPLAKSDDEWENFKSSLRFTRGVVCWNCLLPTVHSV